jgi:hypothetical protein
MTSSDGLFRPVRLQLCLQIGMTLLLLFNQTPPYDRVLLEAAGSAIERGQGGDYAIAVVSAQMAVEIVTEQTIGALLKHRGVPELDEPLEVLISSYSLANDRLRSMYEALSGDPIAQAPFWPAFKEHAKRRGAAVHRGQHVTEAEARASVDAVSQVVTHLRQLVEQLQVNAG